MAYMGTAVNYGRGEMVVTNIGLDTEIGNIATMLLQVESGTTPLQRRLNHSGANLGYRRFDRGRHRILRRFPCARHSGRADVPDRHQFGGGRRARGLCPPW